MSSATFYKWRAKFGGMNNSDHQSGHRIAGTDKSHKVRQRPETCRVSGHCMGKEMGYRVQYIQPGKPQKNAPVECYHRTVRYDWLNQYFFKNIEEEQDAATQWPRTYNNEQPNMAFGGITPKQKLARNMLRAHT